MVVNAEDRRWCCARCGADMKEGEFVIRAGFASNRTGLPFHKDEALCDKIRWWQRSK